MSRFGAKNGRKLPGAEFTWDNDPNGEPDTAPTPLYPVCPSNLSLHNWSAIKAITREQDGEQDAYTDLSSISQKYTVPQARSLNEREQKQVDLYRALREQFHDGPYYSVLDPGLSGRKTKAARQHFDPFHGMPSYSGKYQKKKRAIPKLSGRPYSEFLSPFLAFIKSISAERGEWLLMMLELVMKYFPRDDLWEVIQPNFKAGAAVDGFVARMVRPPMKRGFEDDDEEEEEDIGKRRKTGDEDDEGGENDDLLEPDDEQGEEEIMDDDFEDDDDEMGGDYNAEQYFDGGDDEYGDDGFGDGGGGGDEDTY